MKTLLIYLLQIMVTSGILYGYYHFALRNKGFHRYNRFYLLAATILSIAVPFLNIPVYFTQSATESSFVLETLTVISSAGASNPIVISRPETHSNWFTWENLSLLFYILVASLVLFRIVFSLLKIRRMLRNNPTEQLGKIHFVNTAEPGTPFSFFRWLFWNKKIELHSEKGEQIFRHELFHIEQKHSWDTIYMELLTVVFWINPFFYLIRKELKAIHEFLADQFAVSENTKWQYAELLLMQALNTHQHLVHPFFHNQIKRRIAMITTSEKPSHQYLRKMMVLPLVAIVLALFAFKYKERQADKKSQLPEMLQVVSDTIKPIVTDNKIFDRVEIPPLFPGGNAIWKKYLERNLDASIPLKKKAPDGIYTVVIQFIVDKEGSISDVRSLTKHGYGMEEEALRVIKAGPGWTPAVQNGRVVKAYKKQPVTFVVGKGDKNFPGNATVNTSSDQMASDKIFDKIETPPHFPGGDTSWRNYLMRNCRASTPIDSGAPSGTYKVIVQFTIREDGYLEDIKSITNHGYGMEGEVIRLMKNGPPWIPAKQNGHIIRAYVKQPVTFQVTEENYTDLKTTPIKNTTKIPEISVKKLRNIDVYKLLWLPENTEIVSFTFTIDDNNGGILTSMDLGSKFSSITKSLMDKVQANTYITIDNISIRQGELVKKIPSRIYEVIN